MVTITVYIDIILLENLLMNYIILYATSIITKNKAKYLRMFSSSLIGAIYAILIYVTNIPIYSNLISKIILSIVMVFIAYNPKNFKLLCKQILFFYLTSFVFGGASLSLIHFISPKNVISRNGLDIKQNTLKLVLFGGIIGFIVITIAFKIVKTKISKKDMFCDLTIKINNKLIDTKAMIDTGNLLKEPITNIPVIVVEHTLLYDCIPKEILNNLEKILAGDFNNISEEVREEYISKLKLIPYASLGKQNGMLIGIKPDEVKIKKEDEISTKSKVIIGIYNKSLTKRGEYRALLGIELI